MQPQPSDGYDRASTLFSPDGLIFQVNYAQEAVRKGTTVVALRCSDGVGLLAVRREYSRLVESDTVEKIYQIDDHIGGVTTGIIADGRVLVDIARREAQQSRFSKDTPITVQELADELSYYLTVHTQYGGTRPYGCALLIAGVDEQGPRVVVADPSGALYEYHAAVRGQGEDATRSYLLEHHDPEKPLEQCIVVGIKALLSASAEGEIPVVEIVTISGEPPMFTEMKTDEFGALMDRAQKEYSAESGKGGV